MVGDTPATGATSTPTTMRRVVVGADHEVALEVADVPRPGPGEVLVRARRVGVCGSDTHAQHGRHPFIVLPYAPGHEVLGVVAEVGPDGDGLQTRNGVAVRTGQRVVVEPTLPCWSCKQCRAGRENLCEQLRFFGCGHDQGGMAELFTVPVDRLHAVADDLDDDQAILIEPLATPVHAVRVSGLRAGQTVAIQGAGTIGLLVLAAARRAGARRIVVTDVLASKRELALRLGADAAVDALTPDLAETVRAELGESADVVFDCVANEATIRAGVAMASKNGTLVVVGVPAGDVLVPLALVQDHQIRIQGSATYLPTDYAESEQLLRDGDVRAADVITGRFPLDRAADAFAASSGGEHIKVIVTLDANG